MGDDVEARLASAAEAMREYDLTGARRDQLRRRIEDHERQLATVREELAGEEADVARLEGFSLTRLLLALRGGRPDALERKRAAADLARYRLAEMGARLMAIVHEEAAAQARLDLLAGAPAAMAAMLDEKERLLTSRNDPRGARLLELTDERGRCTTELKEIGEAQRTAAAAATALAEVQRNLGIVEHSAIWFERPGVAATIAKKRAPLDDAAAAAAEADRRLALLRTELAEVGAADVRAQLGITELTKLVDIHVRDYFANFANQLIWRGIGEAQADTDRCERKVKQIQSNLDRRAKALRGTLAELDRERRGLLTQ